MTSPTPLNPMTPMTPVDLFLLGRTLMKIGEDALPAPQVGTAPHPGSVRPILIALSDIAAHPDSAIGEIARRTGLPQSQVSTAVARLKETGSIETTQDPTDRRRILVRTAATPSARVAEVRAAGIEDALTRALATTDEQVLAQVTAALTVLARHLPPAALTRLRP
ncbi:MarR family winged helix-turn-helix transcriptional regulator [Embleya sp. MST-111070]|uniref:MarR family winged helix-turn-helix transcriptional regulator n=1 Tax=Embleya sp. MST-111070 TaxID=3398231 RepID=UPI003F739C60